MEKRELMECWKSMKTKGRGSNIGHLDRNDCAS